MSMKYSPAWLPLPLSAQRPPVNIDFDYDANFHDFDLDDLLSFED